jgi:radical SAM superfamily enzyme YgiQ (UPF0313 family)
MTGEQIRYALDISKIFHGRLKIVWGGMHPTLLPKQVISSEYIDYVVIGEGEEAFLNLLDSLSGKPAQKELFLDKRNANYSYNYIADLNRSEYIDFDKYPIKEQYFVRRDGFKKAFNLETSRGCPYNCYYCHNSIFRKPYRTLTAAKVLSIIDILRFNYKVDGIVFQEDNFFGDVKRTNEIVEGLICRRDIGWKANSRINYFYKLASDKQFMNGLLCSNCKLIQFGIESGSWRILKAINKNIDLDKVIEANKELSQYPISIRYNFIIGFPGETEEDIKETLKLIDKLQKDNSHAESPFVNIYNPYPGTQLYQEALRCGFKEPQNIEEWSALNWNRTCLSSLASDINVFVEKISKEYFRKSNYLSFE